MPGFIKNSYLAGLGLVALTYEKAEKLTMELIKKGELAKEKQQVFTNNLVDRAKKNYKEIENMIKEKASFLAQRGGPLKEKQDKLISELAEKVKSTGSITEQKIKQTVKEVLAKSREIKQKQKKLIDNIKEKRALSEEEKIEEILVRLNVPTGEDLEEIKKKLNKLLEKIE